MMSFNDSWILLLPGQLIYNETTTVRDVRANYKIRMARTIWLYASPLILLSGLVGNSLAIAVLLKKTLRQSSTFCLLAALAVSDSLVLSTGLLRDWLSLITPSSGFRWFNSMPWLCKPVEIISFTAMYCSAWLIVAVSVDRYLAICRPVQSKTMRTPAHACIVVGSTAFLALLAAITFSLINSDKKCFSNDSPFQAVVWIDICLYSLLPSFTLFILNGLILQRMVKRLNRRRSIKRAQFKQPEEHQLSPNNENDENLKTCTTILQHNSIQQQKLHLGCVTLTLSLTYLITTLPNSILLIIMEIGQYVQVGPTLFLAQTFTMLLWYLNHAVNFYLYCLTAQQVRSEVTILVKCYQH